MPPTTQQVHIAPNQIELDQRKPKRLDGNLLKENFRVLWPQLLHELSSDPNLYQIPDAVEWLQIVLERNVPQGKQNRAMAGILFYHSLVKNPTEEDIHLINVLGWIAEIGQASALIADDVVDLSETRRGNICWYKEKDVGLSAVNDAFLLENITYFILYKYFSEKKIFPKLLSLAHDGALKTIFGQSLDTRFGMNFNLDECTVEKYQSIVQYKTSYYTFYHPYATALAMAEITDPKIYKLVEEIALVFGYMFQVQDDFLDCFGHVAITGKVGTDISDSKCTWLIAKALEFANPEQKEILRDNYGRKEKVNEEKVKALYRELGIVDCYKQFEKECYVKIGNLVKNLPPECPKAPFLALLNSLYLRNK